MAAGRSAHDAYTLRIDTPFGGMFAYHADGLFGIGKGYFMVPVGHTVFQYCIGDALCVEPGSHVVSLVLHGQASVAASRTHDDGHAVGVGGRVHRKGRGGDIGHPFVVMVLSGIGQFVVIGGTVGP